MAWPGPQAKPNTCIISLATGRHKDGPRSNPLFCTNLVLEVSSISRLTYNSPYFLGRRCRRHPTAAKGANQYGVHVLVINGGLESSPGCPLSDDGSPASSASQASYYWLIAGKVVPHHPIAHDRVAALCKRITSDISVLSYKTGYRVLPKLANMRAEETPTEGERKNQLKQKSIPQDITVHFGNGGAHWTLFGHSVSPNHDQEWPIQLL